MATIPGLGVYTTDHTLNTFVQFSGNSTNVDNLGAFTAVYDSGTFTTLPDGILSIGLTYAGGNGQGAIYNPPQPGSWAIEWPGQGGLVGMLGQPVTPIAPSQTCPSIPTAQSFQFVTLPNAGDNAGTAYGSLNIAAIGSAVNFTNISQLSISGSSPTDPSPTTVAGTCSPTVLGHVISVPDTVTITDPGNGEQVTPTATIAIGPTGFLVEDNGGGDNVMGAGNGAIGLPVPAGPLSTSTLTSAQYTGFIYGTGALGNNLKNLVAVPSSTLIASFGYSDVQTACPTPPAPQTSTILYGGEFAANDPAKNSYGNCDFAVDFGVQDAKTNGLYSAATVWIGAAFPGNPIGQSYSFPAVAIAAQLQGKNAIFVIGLDTTGLKNISQGQQTQDWGIYLLQSN
jgi:hypothetical protein